MESFPDYEGFDMCAFESQQLRSTIRQVRSQFVCDRLDILQKPGNPRGFANRGSTSTVDCRRLWLTP